MTWQQACGYQSQIREVTEFTSWGPGDLCSRRPKIFDAPPDESVKFSEPPPLKIAGPSPDVNSVTSLIMDTYQLNNLSPYITSEE